MNNSVERKGMPTKPLFEGEKRKRRRIRNIILFLIVECCALFLIFSYGLILRRVNLIQRIDDWSPEEVVNEHFSVDLPQYQYMKGHWALAIFGVDSRGTNVGKGTNADVNIVCDVNHDTGEIKLVSVFRDSYLNINDEGSYNKLNQAYFAGGPNQAVRALNKNLDLNITDFATFNWKAVAEGINILGGVEMEITKSEFRYINSFITETVKATGIYSEHLKGPGLNHLDGVQAVAYGRLRLMDTDYARTERQRKVIKAAFEKAKKADFATLNQLTVVVFPQIATSVEMDDLMEIIFNINKYHIGETRGFPFARGDKNMGKKGSCVIPKTLESNVIELHEFLYGETQYQPSDTLLAISEKISSDTGMYKKGVSVAKVSTAGGGVPDSVKQTEAAAKETAKAERPSETAAVPDTESSRAAEAADESTESRSETQESETGTTESSPSRPADGSDTPAPTTSQPSSSAAVQPESTQHPRETTERPKETEKRPGETETAPAPTTAAPPKETTASFGPGTVEPTLPPGPSAPDRPKGGVISVSPPQSAATTPPQGPTSPR